MKRIILLSLLIGFLSVHSSFAKPVKKEKAIKAAKTFLVVRYPTSDPNSARTINKKGRSTMGVEKILPVNVNKILVGYVVNLEPTGFILFSGDDETPPVKIYSDTGSYKQLPDGLRQVLELELLEDNTTVTSTSKKKQHVLLKIKRFSGQWGDLTSDEIQNNNVVSYPTGSPGVAILTTTWDQDDPYNVYAPSATGGPGGRAWAGCTATALAQVLRHHSFPELVTSNHTYTDSSGSCTGTYSISDVGMGNYDWMNMPTTISTSSPVAQQQAVGQLIFHCAVALESNFEANVTSAFPSSIPNVLQTYFNYTSSNYQNKSGYTSTAWYNEISDDIDGDQPVFYAMWQADGSGGHAVVCDGYRNGNEIHLDLGWSGSGTAWYNMDSVSAGGFTWTVHGAVFDITPTGSSDPVLSNPQVSPSSGVEWETNFKYSVHYYDGDGDIPIANGATVYIDGQDYDMNLESGDPANGVYSYTTQLDVGTHHYAFAFINNNGFDMTSTYINPFVHTEGCGVELKVEVSGGPVTNNIEIEFEYGPDLFNMESQQWYATELPQDVWIDPGQQLMFSVSVESNNHTFIKWEFRDDEGNLVRESTASGYGFILNSGNIHATAYLSYTPINYTISGTVQKDDGSAIPGGVDLTLTSSQQTLNQHIVSDNFSFTGVNGGVPVSITYEASDGGYAFTPSSLSWGNLKSDHTSESVIGYSSDTIVPITSFSMVPPAVSEDSTISFSWIGEDDVTAPENLLYQYKLDGVDADWSLWTLGTFRLYDVENGEYTFWVRAKDEAGNINQAPSNYEFVVNAAPKVISADRINRSVWASRLTLEMPVGASQPNDIFILLPQHSDNADSDELVPVTIHRIDEATPCGASDIVASELGITASIVVSGSGWQVTLPESIPIGQTAQYDIIWGKIKYFGWQESVSIPSGFPSGGSDQSAYLDDSLRTWRCARRVDNKGTGYACDDDGWEYMDMCNHSGIIIPETIMRYVAGQCWGGGTGTSTAFYHGRFVELGTNMCAIWKDEKYEWDGSTDYYYRRYGLQLFDNTGATIGSVDGDYYNRISWATPTQSVHGKIWMSGYEWSCQSCTPSAFYMVLNSTGGTDIAKTNFDTITGKTYPGYDVSSPVENGSNVLFAWAREWETSQDYYRSELAYQVRNTAGSVVKATTVFSGALYPDSVEEDDEYEINGRLLTDNDGKVWLTYSRDRSDQPLEYYYVIIGSDGNIWKGPIQTTNARSFNYCDKDGYIWASENGQLLILNPDDTTAVPPRTGGWTPNQDVGLIAASSGTADYRLYDRWSSETVEVNVPSDVSADLMQLFDLNLWGNNLHPADINLTKGATPVWNQSGQFTGHTTIDITGILSEGENALTMTQDDFLGGQVLVTFPYISPQTLTISSTYGGVVTNPGEGQFQYSEGTVAYVEAVADAIYHFFCWTGTAVDAGKVADRKEPNTTVTMDGDYTLEAAFTIIGDFTGDGRVNLEDFAALGNYWLANDPLIDIAPPPNGDDVIDVFDLALFADHWLDIEYVKFYNMSLDSDPSWSVEGEWAFGQPTGNGGTSYGNPDPGSGYTGDNVYGVNLAGDYAVSVGGPYYLTAGPFDCTGYNNILMKTARWLNTDAPAYVSAKIEASNNGSDWTLIWENTSDLTDSSWQPLEYDISSVADNQTTVYIRWSYQIHDARARAYSGWNVDDIELWGNSLNLPEFALDVSPEWTIDGQWEFGQPIGGGGAYGNPDPSSGYEGNNVYGVNLNGDYNTSVGGPYYLTTGALNCSHIHNVRLRFARWLNSDAPSYVANKIEASSNGADWSVIWEHMGSSDIADSSWQIIEYDMSSIADNQSTVYIRWSYEILDNHAYQYSGWNIDEIKILGEP